MSNLSDLPRYVGGIHPNCDYDHGQIFPARGVKCWQVSRANRTHPQWDDGTGCTYKHAADLAYFADRFYIQYLVNPESEHTGAGFSVLASSGDGIHWEQFKVSFPVYRIPACSIQDYKGLIHSFDGTMYAYMHQRMSFFKTAEGRMLLLGFYGWSPKPWMTNWDNYGIGRVVRELFPDGTLGEIYFIRPNWQGGWCASQLLYPLYTECADRGFVNGCKELLDNSLYVQQWAEENGDQDELIQIKHPKKGRKNEAFCWYHIEEQTIIGLWKHSLTARSDDNGKTWSTVTRSPSLVMSGQKVWASRTSDGRFAMVYDPTLETQHRYPLCVTVSDDGLCFDHMRLVHGEVPPMKFKGFWKDLGPQYMRGIAEGLEQPPDGDLWVTYSVNKEDIWIARIPVPIAKQEEKKFFTENFNEENSLDQWNLYCPKWSFTERMLVNGQYFLRLTDRDPYDYCRVERLLCPAVRMTYTFVVIPRQTQNGCLHMELLDARGITAVRLVFRKDGRLYARTVTELNVMEYEADIAYKISISLNCETFYYQLAINDEWLLNEDGEPRLWLFMSAVNEVSRFVLRTGNPRHGPTLDDDPEGKPEEPLPGCDEPVEAAVYDLMSFAAADAV